jgi:hypothetical protein
LGSGGNILIKPIVNGNSTTQLLKKKEKPHQVLTVLHLENGIQAQMQVKHFVTSISVSMAGAGLYLDLSYAFVDHLWQKNMKF